MIEKIIKFCNRLWFRNRVIYKDSTTGFKLSKCNKLITIGTDHWSHSLNSEDSMKIYSQFKNCKHSALNAAVKSYYEFCNSYVSC